MKQEAAEHGQEEEALQPPPPPPPQQQQQTEQQKQPPQAKEQSEEVEHNDGQEKGEKEHAADMAAEPAISSDVSRQLAQPQPKHGYNGLQRSTETGRWQRSAGGTHTRSSSSSDNTVSDGTLDQEAETTEETQQQQQQQESDDDQSELPGVLKSRVKPKSEMTDADREAAAAYQTTSDALVRARKDRKEKSSVRSTTASNHSHYGCV